MLMYLGAGRSPSAATGLRLARQQSPNPEQVVKLSTGAALFGAAVATGAEGMTAATDLAVAVEI